MTKCVFCGREEYDFMGVHLIKNDGVVDYYCSEKCRKNALKLKRDKRKLKWTEAYRVTLKKTQADEATQKAKNIAYDKAKADKDAAEKKAKK